MADKSASATILNHNYYNTDYGGWLGWNNGQCYFGKNGDHYFPYILKFKTPSFDGGSKSVSFSFAIWRQKGTSSVACHYAICSSDKNKDSYVGKSGSVTDEYQVATGKVTFSNLSGSGVTYEKTFTANVSGLRPNTTYYLYFWPATTGSQFAVMMEPSYISATLYYIQGLVYLDSGSKEEAYQSYIDNGSSWDLFIPNGDNGSGWDIFS